MTRALDEPIPGGERLFRSVASEHVVESYVLPDAVELPRCSFSREKYAAPEDVVVASRPAENGIVWMTAGDLPEPVPREGSAPYEFFAADDPTEENDAHAEVRVRPLGAPFNPKAKIGSKTTRAKAKAALAAKLRIYRAPRP